MVDGVIKPLGELVHSMRYASDLLDSNRVTYTVPWWGPYKAERISEPPNPYFGSSLEEFLADIE